MSTTFAIEATDVVKTYGNGDTAVQALNRASLNIRGGRFTAIMGPSGSGKSTLMHAMAGLDTVDSGSILLGGVELVGMSEKQRTLLRRTKVGFIFQQYNLVPALTAEENIALPLRLAGQKIDKAWMSELAGTLGIADRLAHRPSELSGGQQQRVAVARALISRPEVVFADEPTGALDSRSGQALLAFLRRAACELQQTIVMVTHDPSAAAHADRVEFLSDGEVIDGHDNPTAATVMARMERFEADRTEVAA